jgi:outer membrane protein insertion porin family
MIFMFDFKKIITLIFLFFTFFNVSSYSEVVNKVEVEGNNRISSETIIIFGDVVVGNNYEQSDISLLIKKLYETNFFFKYIS